MQMNTPNTPNPTALAAPRVRFNFGYHDGADAQRAARRPAWKYGEHFDTSYEAGYWAGYEAAKLGRPTDCSAAAWQSHEDDLAIDAHRLED